MQLYFVTNILTVEHFTGACKSAQKVAGAIIFCATVEHFTGACKSAPDSPLPAALAPPQLPTMIIIIMMIMMIIIKIMMIIIKIMMIIVMIMTMMMMIIGDGDGDSIKADSHCWRFCKPAEF